MTTISRFEVLAQKLEKNRGPFNLFALILTRSMQGVISTSGDIVPVQNRWAVVAAAPWLGTGRMADVRALTDAIREVGEERLLESRISRVVVIPPSSESIKLLAELTGGSPEIVLTRSLLLDDDLLSQDERLAQLFADVLRARVLRANPPRLGRIERTVIRAERWRVMPTDRLVHFRIEPIETEDTQQGTIIRRAALVVEAGARFELTGSEPPYIAMRPASHEDGTPVKQLLGRDDPDEECRVLEQITRQR